MPVLRCHHADFTLMGQLLDVDFPSPRKFRFYIGDTNVHIIIVIIAIITNSFKI